MLPLFIQAALQQLLLFFGVQLPWLHVLFSSIVKLVGKSVYLFTVHAPLLCRAMSYSADGFSQISTKTFFIGISLKEEVG